MKKLSTLFIALCATFNTLESTAQCGTAIQFNGTNQYLTTTTLSPQIFDNFTIELWVKPTGAIAAVGQATSGYGGISGQRYALNPDWGGYTNAGAGVSVGTNGVCVIEHADNYIPALLVWNGTLTGWNHIAVVYTNKQPTLYINGVLVATGLTSPRAQVFASYSAIGGFVYGYYSGSIDDFRIWNVSRTATEILNNYNQSITLPNANLKTYLQMNEGSGTITSDASGNGGNGTLTNGPLWVAPGFDNIADVTPPTITCPAAITVTANNTACTYLGAIGTATATDNCTTVTVTGPVPAGAYSLGTTTVTWTATDAAGLIATCTQSVTVVPSSILITSMKSDAAISGAVGTAGVTAIPNNCTLLWSPGGQTTNYITNQTPGTYTVTATDTNGCTKTKAIIIN